METYDPHEHAARLAESVRVPILVVESKLNGRVFIVGEEYPAIGLEPVRTLAIYLGDTR